MRNCLYQKLFGVESRSPDIQSDEVIELTNEICLLTSQINSCARHCRNGTDSVSLSDLFRIKLQLECALETFLNSVNQQIKGIDEDNH